MNGTISVFIDADLHAGVAGGANGIASSVTVPASELVRRCANEAETCTVICVTGNHSIALKAAGESGIVPVLVSPNRQVNVLDDPAIVVVRNGAHITTYLDCPTAGVLFDLTRMRPSDVRAKCDARIDDLLNAAHRAGGISIYGAGTLGRQALDAARRAGIRVKAFLDSNPKLNGTEIDGIPVRLPSAIVGDLDIIVPALGRHVSAVTRAVMDNGALDVMSLSELYNVTRRPGEPETDYLDDLFANRHRYHSLYLALADGRSREVLAAVIRHRLTLATTPLAHVAERDHPQWLAPEFLPNGDADVFVDGGAYDGDTALAYIHAHGANYLRIHAFEPDPDLAARAHERTRNFAGVTVHNVGLSDRRGHLPFRRTGRTDGSIAAASGGKERIAIGTIDEMVPEKITFLKLDVEGEEARTMAGARRHLEVDRPTLAIALYHKAQDLWDLPRRILDITPDYQLYLRHYTDVAYETVVYAVPPSVADR